VKKYAVIAGLLSMQAMAGSSGVNSGSSLTSGPSSSHFSIYAAANNPAMGSLMNPEDERWRISYLPSFAVNLELGDVDNFADDIDELIDIVEDPSSSGDSATEILNRFNDVLVRMGDQGYIKNSVSIHAPVAPLYYYSEDLQGTFFVDLSIEAQVGLRVLDAELSLDPVTQGFLTDTSLYLKSGIQKKLSLGYSREVFSDHHFIKDKGKLYAGATFSFVDMELSKQVTRIVDLDGAEVSDVLRDEYDNNLSSSTGFAIDVGLVWDAEWYRAGLTLENLNSPEFDYGDIGTNCNDRPENTIERNSCEVARSFIDQGRITATETHTQHALLRVDGLVKITDRWFVSGAMDMAEYDDFVGFENQWLNIATSYETEGMWVPSARLGYQKNLTGAELSSFTFGFTFFKSVSLDFEWSPDSVDVDGDSAPRRVGFALGFEEKF